MTRASAYSAPPQQREETIDFKKAIFELLSLLLHYLFFMTLVLASIIRHLQFL